MAVAVSDSTKACAAKILVLMASSLHMTLSLPPTQYRYSLSPELHAIQHTLRSSSSCRLKSYATYAAWPAVQLKLYLYCNGFTGKRLLDPVALQCCSSDCSDLPLMSTAPEVMAQLSHTASSSVHNIPCQSLRWSHTCNCARSTPEFCSPAVPPSCLLASRQLPGKKAAMSAYQNRHHTYTLYRRQYASYYRQTSCTAGSTPCTAYLCLLAPDFLCYGCEIEFAVQPPPVAEPELSLTWPGPVPAVKHYS